jgi:DEAD/DEAH box helicase domain-containing protein
MRKIVLDIETEGNWTGDHADLEVTVAGIYDSGDDSYHCFAKNELAALWPFLERADLLIGYNSEHFDLPILNKYYAGDLLKIKSLDLLLEIKKVLNRRLKLDNIASATLGKHKSGNGLEAQTWWKAGDVEKVKSYCLDDVRLTKELYDYAQKHGVLKYRDFGSEEVREIKLDTKNWEKDAGAALTHTLPF